MEEFLQINWCRKSQRNRKEFIDNDAFIEKSATYKILHDSFCRPWNSDSSGDEAVQEKQFVTNKGNNNAVKQEKKNASTKKQEKTEVNTQKVNETKKKYIPHVRPPCQYPRFSCLNAEEQRAYVHLMQKFGCVRKSYLHPHEQKPYQVYRVLQGRVQPEQAEYLEFIKKFSDTNQNRFQVLSHDARRYVEEVWMVYKVRKVKLIERFKRENISGCLLKIGDSSKHRLKRPLDYPQMYEQVKMVPLVPQEELDPVKLYLEKVLLEQGEIPRLELPTFVKQTTVLNNYFKLTYVHPPDNSLSDLNERNAIYKIPVSKDGNAEELAKLTGADIVISTSGLKYIADNHPPSFEKSWEIPVVVKEHEIIEYGVPVKKKIVYIDKPFPPKKMTRMEKNIWFQKFALKALICKAKLVPERTPKKEKSKQSQRSKQETAKGDSQEEDLFGSMNSFDDLECFGTETSKVPKIHVKKEEVKSVKKKKKRGKLADKNMKVASDAGWNQDNETSGEDIKSGNQSKDGCTRLTLQQLAESAKEFAARTENSVLPDTKIDFKVPTKDVSNFAGEMSLNSSNVNIGNTLNTPPSGVQDRNIPMSLMSDLYISDDSKSFSDDSPSKVSEKNSPLLTYSQKKLAIVEGMKSQVSKKLRFQNVNVDMDLSLETGANRTNELEDNQEFFAQNHQSGSSASVVPVLQEEEYKSIDIDVSSHESKANFMNELSDSESDNLVIADSMNEDEIQSDHDSHEVKTDDHIQEGLTLSPGRVTRSMSKMLAKMSLIQESVGKKPIVRKLTGDKQESASGYQVSKSPAPYSVKMNISKVKMETDSVSNEVQELLESHNSTRKRSHSESMEEAPQLSLSPVSKTEGERDNNMSIKSLTSPSKSLTSPSSDSCAKKRKVDSKLEQEKSQGLLDDLLQQQMNMLKSGSKLHEEGNPKRMERLLSEQEAVPIQSIPPAPNHNIMYCLWRLKHEEDKGKELKIVVRSSIDGYSVSRNKEVKRLCIVPKLEYQPGFGAEKSTLSEVTRQWIDILVKPLVFIYRARINAFTGEIIMTELVNAQKLSREGENVGFKPADAMGSLHSVLSGLTELQPGHYVISHDPKVGAFISVLQHTAQCQDSNNLYDLHASYNVRTRTDMHNQGLLWVPIDTDILTPANLAFGRVPATFCPPDTRRNKVKALMNNGAKKGRNRKKRNWMFSKKNQ